MEIILQFIGLTHTPFQEKKATPIRFDLFREITNCVLRSSEPC